MLAKHAIVKLRLFHGWTHLPNRCRSGFYSKASVHSKALAANRQGELAQHEARGSRQNTLRKVAIEAERTLLDEQNNVVRDAQRRSQVALKKVTAYSAAEQYDMALAARLLRQEGYQIDPMNCSLYPQVLHLRLPNSPLNVEQTGISQQSNSSADVMIFPSGTVVAWNVAEKVALRVVEQVLVPAALNVHYEAAEIEKEDMDFMEDASKTRSEIAGETIVIGTCDPSVNPVQGPFHSSGLSSTSVTAEAGIVSGKNTVLAKIAFASGIARSTKLAMLERATEAYIASTRSIPLIMSRGWSQAGHQPRLLHKVIHAFGLTSRLPFSRPFILQKTGELLSIRAQLNLYGELTDSLPDLFWDSKHDLWLENYYDMVGRALDIGARIKILNQKMDYAQEIATTLRETLNERHNLRLEWGIIVLIAIEVLFEIDQRWRRIE